MSTTLNISFIPKKKSDYSEIYQRLSNWMRQHSESFSQTEILDSADYTSYKVETIAPEEILKSNKAVTLSFFLSKYKPLEIRGDLWLYGNRHNGGYPAKRNGNIKFSLDERDVWGIYRREYLEKGEYEKARDREISVLFEVSEFFIDLVQICEDVIHYASFYTESGMPTPFTSSMAYYSSAKQFVLDYKRIVIESKSNNCLVDFFGREQESNFFTQEILEEDYYKSFYDEQRGNLVSLINVLNLELADFLSKLDEELIMENLQLVLKKNEDVLFNRTNNGFVLCTFPLYGLWTVYFDFLKQLFPEIELDNFETLN